MEKKGEILWLASWYPTRLDPYPGDFIQRHAKALALYHKVHVLHIAKDEDAQLTKSEKTEKADLGNLSEIIHYYHPPKTGIRLLDRFISSRQFFKAGKRLIAQFVAENPTALIHVHVAMRHGLLAVWAKRKFGIPYVITEHWTGYNRGEHPSHLQPGKLFWQATKRIFRGADYFYPEVSRVGNIVNETICPIPFKAVANVVDTALFSYQPTNGAQDGFFHFVHVSTLSYQKNIVGILNVIERLAGFEDVYRFTLVGPAEVSLVERVAQSPVLSRLVRFTGALQYQQVAKEVKKANCLLMFSRYENQPCVILEALCAGLPVISTNVGGISEVLNEANGILLSSENEPELEQAIHNMFTTYNSYNRMAISKQATDLYNFDTIGQQMLDYYRVNSGYIAG